MSPVPPRPSAPPLEWGEVAPTEVWSDVVRRLGELVEALAEHTRRHPADRQLDAVFVALGTVDHALKHARDPLAFVLLLATLLGRQADSYAVEHWDRRIATRR